jgi:hypothetical protein
MISSSGRSFAKDAKTLNVMLSDATCNENKQCLGRWLNAMKGMVVDDQEVSVSETYANEPDDYGLCATTTRNRVNKMQAYRGFSKKHSPFPIRVSGNKDVSSDSDSKMRGEFCVSMGCHQNEFRNSVSSAVLNVANLFKQTACEWLENCYYKKTNVMKYTNRIIRDADVRLDEFTIHVGFFPDYVAVVTVCNTKILYKRQSNGTLVSDHLANIQVETFKYKESQRSQLECLLQTPQTFLPYMDNLLAFQRQRTSCTFHQKDMDSVLRMFEMGMHNVLGRLWDNGRFNPSGMNANRLRYCMRCNQEVCFIDG